MKKLIKKIIEQLDFIWQTKVLRKSVLHKCGRWLYRVGDKCVCGE